MSDRRSFLKYLGLTGSLLAAPAGLYKAVAGTRQSTIDLSNVTLKGKVHAGGKGIEGVAVTDGNNVVLTNKNGLYELISNQMAEFVYISLPSGYSFPHQQSITQFYGRIKAQNGIFYQDFALTKLSQDDTNHNFVVWADPQIKTKSDAQKLISESAPDLKNLIGSYPKETLFHGIGCGDLVWDSFERFADYKQAIHLSGIPFFNVIGNHDMDLTARTDEGSSETFKQNFGPSYYSFNRGKIHYIVLDDVFYLGVEKRYMGYINEQQFRWLEQDLRSVQPGSTIVLSLHIPTNTAQKKRDASSEPETDGVLLNRKRLYDVLKAYKVYFMSGHTHFNEIWIDGNHREHNHGTVCGAWWTGPVCGDGTPSGYGVYEVKGSELEWFYKSTGFPKSHQLRIYPPGKHREFPQEACINVWNYDANWKLEWFADERSMGRPEQRTAFDPWAFELYQGQEHPNTRKWIEPVRTDHLFFVTPPQGTKTLKVQATDPFGKTYTASIQL